VSYMTTQKRDQLIRDLGYNLVVIWEADWMKLQKAVKLLQRGFRYNLSQMKTHQPIELTCCIPCAIELT
jgi:hypothetical protein